MCTTAGSTLQRRVVLAQNLKCPQPPLQLPLAEIMMFHLPEVILRLNCALYPLQGEMTL